MPRTIVLEVTTTGSAGSATGTTDSMPLHGVLDSVQVEYLNSAPNTTTVDLDTLGQGNSTYLKLLDKAASNTNTTHYPRRLGQDNTGANLTGQYDYFVLSGHKVRVSVAASNALAPAVRVTLNLMEV